MIIREELYRLSEARFNKIITDAQYWDLYMKILDQAKSLVEAEAQLEAAHTGLSSDTTRGKLNNTGQRPKKGG